MKPTVTGSLPREDRLIAARECARAAGRGHFNEAYADLIQACNDLHPANVTAEVTKALQAVELDQPGRCSGITERAPASAVNHAGSAATTRFDATPDTTFGVGQDMWLQFDSASPNRTLDFQLLPRNSARPIWQETTPLALATGSGTVLSDSTLFVRFGALMSEGSYDLLVDGNRDGHYQPWADLVLPITVMASTGVGGASLPAVTALKAIQPNPMRQRTQIAFSLAHPSQVALRVYDLAGRRVRTIASERLPAGTHVRGWDGRHDQGVQTGAGVYFVKLLAGTAADSRTLVRTQ